MENYARTRNVSDSVGIASSNVLEPVVSIQKIEEAVCITLCAATYVGIRYIFCVKCKQ